MKTPLILLLAATLPLAACGSTETETVRETATATTGKDGDVQIEKRVVVKTDGDSGEIAIDLPGGGGASIRLPEGVAGKLGENTRVELGGVGLYPGANVNQIASVANEKGGVKSATVDVAFTAPATPDTVAGWYLAQMQEQGHSVTRSGNSLKGTTKDGERFSLDLTPDGKGSKGKLKIVDEKKA
ncbi:MAG: hypothetical protein DI568_15380 [Sphingomonas sp.]|nr:MAG: hypothetical protein DI568_15380 [Sphingomonas sp.]